MELLNFLIGVAALIIAVAAIAIERRHRQADAVERASERKEAKTLEREERITAVTDRYINAIPRTSGLDGALRAGVIELRDASEVSDFCKRASARVSRDPVLPPSVRENIQEEQLLTFFQRLAETPNWQDGSAGGVFQKLLNEFSARESQQDPKPLVVNDTSKHTGMDE